MISILVTSLLRVTWFVLFQWFEGVQFPVVVSEDQKTKTEERKEREKADREKFFLCA